MKYTYVQPNAAFLCLLSNSSLFLAFGFYLMSKSEWSSFIKVQVCISKTMSSTNSQNAHCGIWSAGLKWAVLAMPLLHDLGCAGYIYPRPPSDNSLQSLQWCEWITTVCCLSGFLNAVIKNKPISFFLIHGEDILRSLAWEVVIKGKNSSMDLSSVQLGMPTVSICWERKTSWRHLCFLATVFFFSHLEQSSLV